MTEHLSTYLEGHGNYIPVAAFENEPGPPRALSSFMSAESLIRFYLGTIVTRSAVKAIRARGSATLH